MGFCSLVTSTYYGKVKAAASTGLQTNTSATESLHYSVTQRQEPGSNLYQAF